MQERGSNSVPNNSGGRGQLRLSRPVGVAALITCLVLSSMPGLPSSAAAPPDSAPVEIPFTAPLTEAVSTGTGRQQEIREPTSASNRRSADVEAGPGDANRAASATSVRPRGLEAPVVLHQADDRGGEGGPEPQTRAPREQADPGDGPAATRDRRPRERQSDRAELPNRLWPMPKDTYTFTQQFGCVPQLGNLYLPGAGCPPEAPVIHTGIDLAAPEGTPFYAAASGWVTLAGYDRPTPDANTRITIQHDGRNEDYATDYLHWIASYVEEGDYVRAGEPIGEVGNVGYSTGPHLHFSVTDLDTGENVDPMRWLPGDSAPDDYPRSTLPRASMRLPAGTTAGQPESADPSPPPPPERQDVPDSPPAERDDDNRSQRRDAGARDERRASSERNTADESSQPRRDRASSDEKPAASKTDETTKEPRDKERERLRERSKDGTDSESAETGEDGKNRKRADESTDEPADRDRRKDRGESNDADDGKPRDDSGGIGGKRDDSAGNGGAGGKRDDSGRDSGKRDDSGRDVKDGRDGSNGATGQDGGDGEDGGDGQIGGDGGNGGDGSSGGDGGNGGEGGDGSGSSGGDGGDGGNGGDSVSDPEGDGARGGDGGAGGKGGDATT